MTKEEKLAILEAAEERAYGVLAQMSGADLASEAMAHLMENIASLAWEVSNCTDTIKCEAAPEKEPVKLDPIEEPKPVERHTQAPAITKDEVRKRLSVLQTNADLDIAALMQSMGYSKLSDIPADRYEELLEQAQKIADGEG